MKSLHVDLGRVPPISRSDDPEVQEEERNIQKNGAKESQPEPEIFQANAFMRERFTDPAPIL